MNGESNTTFVPGLKNARFLGQQIFNVTWVLGLSLKLILSPIHDMKIAAVSMQFVCRLNVPFFLTAIFEEIVSHLFTQIANDKFQRVKFTELFVNE